MLNVAVRSKGGALVDSVGDWEIHAELQVRFEMKSMRYGDEVGLVLQAMKNGMPPGKEQNFLINQNENPKRKIGKNFDPFSTKMWIKITSNMN